MAQDRVTRGADTKVSALSTPNDLGDNATTEISAAV